MNKMLIAAATATGLLCASQSALAEGDTYIGAQYTMFTVSTSGADDLEPDGMALVLGGKLSDNFMIEGRFGRSLSDDNIPGVALKVDEQIGFYVKGGMEFADMVFPYVALGYTKVDFETRGAIDQTESDLSYGVGADLHFGNLQVGIEWMMLQDKTDYELEGLSLTGAWRF
ncbi:porin family protein [Ketobacter alkanivorans]|uniref:Outer membrane protein beta-barrel domain-containing protein n=1 Tax=Ketobacter alkanivorans TaxID=1917421 RepID=A0A2K9LK22_9GAMM|nr:porin family protein [Ketobacter alkanivorans]AUM11845.1 hypothetical protein Kalk_05145 [Ketobacter alkanivorans]MCP5016693.1 porin family protein [Ketobacter sp.]